MSEYNDCPALTSGNPSVCRMECKKLRDNGQCRRDKDESKEAED